MIFVETLNGQNQYQTTPLRRSKTSRCYHRKISRNVCGGVRVYIHIYINANIYTCIYMYIYYLMHQYYVCITLIGTFC